MNGFASGAIGGLISDGDDAGTGSVTRDHRQPGFWAMLTAEPRAGVYSWRQVAPTSTGWLLLPAEIPNAYGTAHATTPSLDSLPAREVNGATGLPANTTTGKVVWLEFEATTPGYRFSVGGGSATTGTARTSATNDGTQWTAAKLVRTGDPKPGAGAATGEDVQVQPLYGAGVTVGGVTFGPHTLASGLDYLLAHDSGTTDGGTPAKRRLYVMPIGLIACDAGTLKGL